MELIFEKTDFCYQTSIELGDDEARMILDTGSPITTISIPVMLQITGESLFEFRKKVRTFMEAHTTLSLGVYGSQLSDVRHEFLPYLVKDIRIGGVLFPFFLFWVDITQLDSKHIIPTTILFGYDYIKQGRKTFDEKDYMHITFESIRADTFSVEYAISNINDEATEIQTLME